MELAKAMLCIYKTYLTVVLLFFRNGHVRAGTCWQSKNSKGLCEGPVSGDMDPQECCRLEGGTFSWTPHINVDSGQMFYWTMLSDGAPDCSTCKSSCEDLQCGPGQKCRMRSEGPRCVCSPDCSTNRLGHRGPVCGTDGVSYRNHCALLRGKCKKQDALELDYFGECQSSCDNVECAPGKNCVEDQFGLPHCVICQTFCPSDTSDDGHETICGNDGVTYRSICELRRATCLHGRSIGIAYDGPCQDLSCDKPCSHAGGLRSGRICGTDNVTYNSWCEMRTNACTLGIEIETKHHGPCQSTLPSSIKDIYGSVEYEES